MCVTYKMQAKRIVLCMIRRITVTYLLNSQKKILVSAINMGTKSILPFINSIYIATVIILYSGRKNSGIMENGWWCKKARQIQGFADSNETQKFCEAIKTVYGPTHYTIHHVKSKDGNTVIRDRQGILSRWAEHLGEQLNCINPTYTTLL